MSDRKSNLPKGMIFDMDDTIVAFEAVSPEAWRRVCRRFAPSLRREPDRIYEAIQEVRSWYWSDDERNRKGRLDLDRTRQEIVGAALGRLGIGKDGGLAGEVTRAYASERVALMRFFPGAEETLEHLTGLGLSLALVSNGEAGKQRQKVERFGLTRFFRTVLIEGETGIGKPDEAVFRRALADLGLAADEVWAIGDNLVWDIAGPQKLGIYSIWNDYQARGLPPASSIRPDRIVTSIHQLIE